jgi:hypothetical protein
MGSRTWFTAGGTLASFMIFWSSLSRKFETPILAAA